MIVSTVEYIEVSYKKDSLKPYVLILANKQCYYKTLVSKLTSPWINRFEYLLEMH